MVFELPYSNMITDHIKILKKIKSYQIAILISRNTCDMPMLQMQLCLFNCVYRLKRIKCKSQYQKLQKNDKFNPN